MNLSPAALGAIGWLCSVLALCALSFWLGMRVQARRDFRSFESMLRAGADVDDDEPTVRQESDHYGVP